MKRFFIILATLITAMSYGMTSTTVELKVNAEGLVTPPPKAPYRSCHHSYHKSLINPIAKRHKNSWTSPVAALTAMRDPLKTFFGYKPKLELPKQEPNEINLWPEAVGLNLPTIDHMPDNLPDDLKNLCIGRLGLNDLLDGSITINIDNFDRQKFLNQAWPYNIAETQDMEHLFVYHFVDNLTSPVEIITGLNTHLIVTFISNHQKEAQHNIIVFDKEHTYAVTRRCASTQSSVNFSVWQLKPSTNNDVTQRIATKIGEFSQTKSRSIKGHFMAKMERAACSIVIDVNKNRLIIANDTNIEIRDFYGTLLSSTPIKSPVFGLTLSPQGKYLHAYVTNDRINSSNRFLVNSQTIWKCSDNNLLQEQGSLPHWGWTKFNETETLLMSESMNYAVIHNLDDSQLAEFNYNQRLMFCGFAPNKPDTIAFQRYPIQPGEYNPVYEYDLSGLKNLTPNQKLLLLILKAKYKPETSLVSLLFRAPKSVALTSKQKDVFNTLPEILRKRLIAHYNIDLTKTASPPVTQEQQIISSSNSASSNKGIFMGIGLGLAALAGGIYWYMKGR